MLRFGILGSIELYDGEQRRSLAGPRQVALLAFLLLHANRAVSADQLVAALWSEQSPAGAVKRLQVAIARLRRALAVGGAAGGSPLRTVAGGYLLAVGRDALDADVFRARVEQGCQALDEGRPRDAAGALVAALALWRGPPLADVAYEEFAQGEIRRLEELRLTALEARLDADLKLGRHAVIIGELTGLVSEHPTRERLARRLMLAQYRSGRQADALETFQRVRAQLMGELGLEPGPALQRLQAQILEHADTLDSGAAPPLSLDSGVGLGELDERSRQPPLVGREPELAQVDRSLVRLSEGRQRCLEVSGQPGLGKTRLLQALINRAERRGHRVLSGSGSPFERDVPYGLLIDTLDDHLAALGERRLEQICGPAWPELAPLFPALGRARGPMSSSTLERPRGALQEERYRTHRAIRRLLAALAAERPLVLAVDDAQWADPATVELLSHVLRRPTAAPLLVAVGVRAGQAPPILAAALAACEREGTGDRVSLRPLPDEALDELIGPGLDTWTREHLRRESRGNPLYAIELARAHRRGDQTPPRHPAGGLPGSVPPVVAQAIAGELSALPAAARLAVQAAAVTGEPFATPAVARAAGISEESAQAGLDSAARSGVIRPAEPTGELAFPHPLIRRAAYESAPPAWRRAAHERCAQAMRAAGAPAPVWAHHLERCAERGDEPAIRALEDAAHTVSAQAPATAARWLRTALRLLAPSAPDDRRLELLFPLAIALGAAGDLEGSRAALHETLALLTPEAAEVHARVVGAIAFVEHTLGHHHSATALLRGALAALPDRDSPEAIELTYQLAWDHSYRSEFAQMAALARRAHACAATVDEPRLLAATGALLALAEYNLGNAAAADEVFAHAEAITSSLSDAELAGRLDALLMLGWSAHELEHFDQGLAHLGRGVAICRQTGQGQLYVLMLLGLAMIRAALGDLPAATELTEDAEEVARLSQNPQWLTVALTVRCHIATIAGDPRAALQIGEEAVDASARVASHYYSTLARCALAAARLEAGQPDRCVDELLAACGGPELDPIERPFKPQLYEILTRAELARGHPQQATAWARRADATARGLPVAGRQAEALRARAAVALARGRPRPAAKLAAAAGHAAETTGRVIDSARARLIEGRALAAAGEPTKALDELTRARTAFAACGARHLEDDVARELRRLSESGTTAQP